MVGLVTPFLTFTNFKSWPKLPLFSPVETTSFVGPPKLFTCNVMPMGWSFAPCIAQRASNCIVAETLRRVGTGTYFLKAWVDNFIGTADSFYEASRLLEEFKGICRELNLELHDPTPITSTIECLGLVVDLLAKTVAHEKKFLEKFSSRLVLLSKTLISYREVARVIGSAIWIAYVRQIPLSLFQETLSLARVVADNISGGKKWDDFCAIPLVLPLCEMDALFVTAHQPFRLQKPETCVIAHSDAAVTEANEAFWAFCSGNFVVKGARPHADFIFLEELRAAANAIYHFAALGYGSVQLSVDNSAVFFALRGGHSSCLAADVFIAKLIKTLPRDFCFSVRHVHSAFNEADYWTRQGKFKEAPLEAPWTRTLG